MVVVKRILLALALAHIVAGFALTFLPFAPSAHAQLVRVIFGEGKGSSEVLFLVSVFGPTVASWGILFYSLTTSFFRNPTACSWRALVLSIFVWAPFDSALCIYYGLKFAVAFNAVIAVIFLGLLFTLRGLAYNE